MPSLDRVYEEIEADPYWDHLRLPGIKLVRGYGATRPKVLVVGEAPGAQENARGRPFVGPSGKVLQQLMAIADIRLEGFPDEPANAFVTNVVKYRPPKNRTPSLNEIYHALEGFRKGSEQSVDDSLPEGAGSLRREWNALGSPPLIICVGSVAYAALHPLAGGAGPSLTKVAGWEPYAKRLRREGKADTYVYFSAQFHPAYGMRKGPKVQEVMEQHWTELGDWFRANGGEI